jgi:hypothetical protein
MNPKHRSYHNYGGKGVRVYFGWLHGAGGFEQFLADVGPRPSRRHTLDRRESDGHYDPKNCRWRTIRQQNQKLLYEGDTVVNGMTLVEHAKRLGITYHALRNRMLRNWGDRAFEQPGRGRVR